jgi:hypothetical protein
MFFCFADEATLVYSDNVLVGLEQLICSLTVGMCTAVELDMIKIGV